MMVWTSKIVRTVLRQNILITVTCIRLIQSSSEVRVRFAPSPTGYLHLGGLRTALYNFLFARAKGGKFILRIEDTDQSRLVEGAMEQMYEDLMWTGIVPDEGPMGGGQLGPYQQSKRLQLYKSSTDTLLDNGSAYRCFCTEHRLDLLRRDALRRRQVPRYDNRCRNLTTEEVQEKLKSGAVHCVRLKLVPGCDSFHDLVYGNITHDVASCEGDPVILKSDGFPTYHLANVVDDHHMRISHVMRGVEWQASTPKHLMLYKAFGWEPPLFAHLPLLLNADGTKLSKRQGDVNIKYYRSADIIPRALVNFVTFSGGGFHRDNSDTVRSLDMHQLASEFDLGLVGVASCRVSLERLDDFNHIELVRQIANDTERAALVTQLRNLVLDTYKDRLDDLQLDEEYVQTVLVWSQKRITRLSHLVDPKFSYLWVKPQVSLLTDSEADLASVVLAELDSATEFSQKVLNDLLRSLAKKNSVKVMEVMHLTRLLLCGTKEGPAVGEMLEMLGKKSSLARIEASLQAHHQQSSSAKPLCK